MIAKTPAIVLRYAPSGETSRVVTWLTPRTGRIATVLKGALRPKSGFLGQYDLFYTCELLYYRRPARQVYLAKECAPLKLRPAFRSDWRATALASYWTDLAARVSPAHAPQSSLYRWLELGLDTVLTAGPSIGLCGWLELRLLRQLGLAPQLTACSGCQAALPLGRPTVFSAARGGLLCAACARHDRSEALPVPADIQAILQRWQQAATPEAALRIRCTAAQTAALNRILGAFLRYHLDLALPSRQIALDILQRGNP